MIKISTLNNYNQEVYKHLHFFSFMAILLAIFLNHSNIMFTINLSFADIFLVFLLVYLLLNKSIVIPITPLLFFSIVSVITLFSTLFVAPLLFNISNNFLGVIRDFIKLIVIFCFLVLGYNLKKLNKINIIYKWYSIAAIVIGITGIIFSFLNISLMHSTLFFGGSRFRGFMNDPNYFSVILVTAFVYFARDKKISVLFKWITGLTIFFGVSITGSKTGIVVFSLYILFLTFEYFFISSGGKRRFITKIIYLITIIILLPIGIQLFLQFLSNMGEVFPIFNRIAIVFTDFNSALNDGGSGRDVAWDTAIEIIKASPIFGIGIGTYGIVAYTIAGHSTIAHNTYLQLLAEWGIPLTILFFTSLIFILLKISKIYSASQNNEEIILRDVILVLLLGSLSISLNNVRILWIFLGALIYSIHSYNSRKYVKKME